MAEYKFGCPQCGQHILCTDAEIGAQINCPTCEKAIIVARPKGAAPQRTPPSEPVEGNSSPPVWRIVVICAIAFGLCVGLSLGAWNYFSQQRAQQKELQKAQQKELQKAQQKKANAGPTTNNITASALTLVRDSTLQVSLDVNNASTPTSLSVQSPSLETLNLDVNSVASLNGHILSLKKTLECFDDATINVTGNSNDTLALQAIVGTTTRHTPYFHVTVNAPSDAPSVSIGSFQAGDWGEWLVLQGGGKITITGNLSNTSKGSVNLYIKGDTTSTLQGVSTPHTAHGYKYDVANGTLVLDNNGALINNTSDTGGINKLDQSSFILGTTTNVFYYVTTKQNYSYSPPSEVLVAEDNNYNATVYLGDPESGGGLSVDAKVVNYVSDGDVGFTNSGIFTIGGQNTGGINTYNNAIILGLTPNRGKSVTLVSATGGEVDFNGNILANGSDKTAGVTVGDIAHAGIVKFTAANTYGGNTFINNGTLALSGRGSIAKSQNIVLAAGATLNVSTLTSAFSLGFGQMLGNSASTACINGNVNTASGVVSLIYGTGTPSLTISNGTLNVANSTMFKIDNVGSALSPGSYKIISKQIGGSVTAATGLPAVTVGGGGMVLNTKATLQIIGGELYLIVSMR